jgi:hypothetical protein
MRLMRLMSAMARCGHGRDAARCDMMKGPFADPGSTKPPSSV